MTRDTAALWRDYWSYKTSPGHREGTSQHYAQYAAELKVLWHGAAIGSVFELGCGDGALYPYLGFAGCSYRGVDFSASMLELFRAHHPGIDVIQADGATFRDGGRYDLIFSNGVVQNFDAPMLESHMAIAKRMLAPDGRLVVGSVPWRRQRNAYEAGLLRPGARWRWSRWLKGRLAAALRGDPIGRWYCFADMDIVAKRQGFDCAFFGSMLYPYRFHVVLTQCRSSAGSESVVVG